MTRIIFIQPAVPNYRIPFFETIKEKLNIRIITAESDFLNVKTVYNSKCVSILPGFLSFFKGSLFWMRGLSLYSEYKKGDIVVINGNPRIMNYMLLLFFCKMRGIKTVWWGHGWSAGSFGFLAKIRLLIMKSLSDYQLFYTDTEKDLINSKNAYALNNGLDSDLYKEIINDVNITRVLPSIKGRFDLVFIGRITDKSNFILLLHALSKVVGNIHLNVIGTSENINKYKKEAEKINVSSKITWYGAVFDDIAITKIMMNSHAFVYAGSVGLSLIHAFNYGLPAIIHSSSKYHMPEYAAFSNGINGFNFIENNEESLSKVIDDMSKISDAEYKVLSLNALRTISTTFNINDMSQRFLKLIEDIKCQ